MFEIPDDDDLFSEDNLKDILTESSHRHSAEQQKQGQTEGTNINVLRLHAGSWKAADLAPPSSASSVREERLGIPHSKKMRVLTDVNHQVVTAADEKCSDWMQCAPSKSTFNDTASEGKMAVVSHHMQEDQSSHEVPMQVVEAGLSETTRRRSLRKFPGPAGILPPAKPSELASVLRKNPGGSPEIVSEDNSNKPEEEVCSSQAGVEVFGGAAWQALVADLEPGAEEVLRKFSVRAMLHKASRRLLPKSKIPLLLGVLDSIDFQGADASVVLRDRTGQMQGTLHREVLKDFSTDLQTGTAVVLRQVSVISPSPRTHYLNITTGNIVAIYPGSGSRAQWVLPSPTEESPHSHLSGQSVKSFVHAAEMELLEAANAAKEAALIKLRKQGPSTPNSSAGVGASASASRLGHQGPGLFSNTSFQAVRGSSPSFIPQRPRLSPSPVASVGGRTPFRNTSSVSRLRTPTPENRMPVCGVNPAAGAGQSPQLQNPVVNNTRFSQMQRPLMTGHLTPPCAGGKGGYNANTGARIQPSSVSHSFTTSGGNQTPLRTSACVNFNSQTDMSTHVPAVDNVTGIDNHPGIGKIVMPHGYTHQSQTAGASSQPSQESKWAFKRKSTGPPLPTPAISGVVTNSRAPLSQQRQGREPPAKVHVTNSLDSQTANSSVRLGQPGGGSGGGAVSLTSLAGKVSSNMWDDELDDDILSQMSDDF